MRALTDEIFDAFIGMNPLAYERLASLGANRSAISAAFDRTSPYPPVGILNVEVDAGGYWQPFDKGRPALVHPVTIAGEFGGEIIDLVAWRSGDPLRWYLRTGYAWALGVDALDDVLQSWDEAPELHVHASPLEWLAAGGAGLVVLDWQSPELAELRSVGHIRVADRDFGNVLGDALLRTPRLPTITAGRGEVSYAA